ncbi:MAG: Holliday junction resolvase RuvX [Woeseiaceae bacterium]|nr:Holliday junction resolvase RuvX [Woeseiaceae bacterium]
MPEQEAPATIIAFDYGQRRIGVAVGQTVTGSASPLGVVANNSDNGPDFARITEMINEWRPTGLVVGLPLHADGSASEMEKPVRAFAEALARFDLPIELVDERHTSQEAEQTLVRARQAGSRGRIRKQDIDAAAAVMIAERFLATRRLSP